MQPRDKRPKTKANIHQGGMSIPNQTVTRTRKKGMPKQKHIIPELTYPATSKQGRMEDRIINILDRR
jgi:hypothetical protein